MNNLIKNLIVGASVGILMNIDVASHQLDQSFKSKEILTTIEKSLEEVRKSKLCGYDTNSLDFAKIKLHELIGNFNPEDKQTIADLSDFLINTEIDEQYTIPYIMVADSDIAGASAIINYFKLYDPQNCKNMFRKKYDKLPILIDVLKSGDSKPLDLILGAIPEEDLADYVTATDTRHESAWSLCSSYFKSGIDIILDHLSEEAKAFVIKVEQENMEKRVDE